jgi:hypothetical protein
MHMRGWIISRAKIGIATKDLVKVFVMMHKIGHVALTGPMEILKRSEICVTNCPYVLQL